MKIEKMGGDMYDANQRERVQNEVQLVMSVQVEFGGMDLVQKMEGWKQSEYEGKRYSLPY